MKNLKYILLFSFFYFGCENSSVNIERPEHLPKNVPNNWGTYEHQAYQDGRLRYNEDSSMCFIEKERPETQGDVERMKKWVEQNGGLVIDTLK
jgi:hypothetical protein